MIGGISSTGPVVATSPDGITWTNRTLPGGGGWARLFANARYFLVHGLELYLYVGHKVDSTLPQTQSTIRILQLLLGKGTQ
jgi:hypothetical protein